MSNSAVPRNYLVMVCRHSALLGLLSALGALGRRFESCRPDWDYKIANIARGENVGKNADNTGPLLDIISE